MPITDEMYGEGNVSAGTKRNVESMPNVGKEKIGVDKQTGSNEEHPDNGAKIPKDQRRNNEHIKYEGQEDKSPGG